MKFNKKGFTLIELLVVIAIIGLLATVAVISLNSARTKSRDAKRVGDIRQIQSALEMYYNECGAYPSALTGSANNSGVSGTTCPSALSAFIGAIPTNPAPGGAAYAYTGTTGTTDVFTTYSLTYSLEGITGGLASGGHTATPSGM